MTDIDPSNLTGLAWRKSSYSGGGNDCVEVAFPERHAAVRDSKNPEAGALLIPASEWEDVLAAVRAGHLNTARHDPAGARRDR